MKKSIVVIGHVYATGPVQALESYLPDRCERLLVISHPLFHQKPVTSTFRLYNFGKLVDEGQLTTRVPEFIRYGVDVVISLRWILSLMKRSDLVIGVGALASFIGEVAKFCFLFRQSVYYTIDFSPKRFKNRLFNILFHLIDRFCAISATRTWILATGIQKARWSTFRKNRFLSKLGAHELVVPLGVDDVVLTPYDPTSARLVFIGRLMEKQGLQLVIRALPGIAALVPDVSLTVIGDGPYRSDLESLVRELHLFNRVEFLGFLQSNLEVGVSIARCTIGLATYLPLADSFSFHTDPGKVKQYLAAGLPVCLTDVPAIARELEAVGCARVVEPSVGNIGLELVEMLLNPDKLRAMSNSALAFIAPLRWDNVFDIAFSSLN